MELQIEIDLIFKIEILFLFLMNFYKNQLSLSDLKDQFHLFQN